MSMSDLGPAVTAPLPIASAPTPSGRRTVAAEIRTHVDFAAVLLLLWLALPMVAAALSLLSPAMAQVTALDPLVLSVSVLDLPSLYELLFVGLAGVVLISFCARLALVPGRATGDVSHDITSRSSVRVGVVVAVTNFVALTVYTAAIAEAWIFPLLTFSACQLVGLFVERLRHSADLAW